MHGMSMSREEAISRGVELSEWLKQHPEITDLYELNSKNIGLYYTSETFSKANKCFIAYSRDIKERRYYNVPLVFYNYRACGAVDYYKTPDGHTHNTENGWLGLIEYVYVLENRNKISNKEIIFKKKS